MLMLQLLVVWASNGVSDMKALWDELQTNAGAGHEVPQNTPLCMSARALLDTRCRFVCTCSSYKHLPYVVLCKGCCSDLGRTKQACLPVPPCLSTLELQTWLSVIHQVRSSSGPAPSTTETVLSWVCCPTGLYLSPQKLYPSFTCVIFISGPVTSFSVLGLRSSDMAQRPGWGPEIWPLQKGCTDR